MTHLQLKSMLTPSRGHPHTDRDTKRMCPPGALESLGWDWVGRGRRGCFVLFGIWTGSPTPPFSERERLSSVGGHHSKPLRRSDVKGSVVIEEVSQGRQSQGYSEQGKDDLAESWETLA